MEDVTFSFVCTSEHWNVPQKVTSRFTLKLAYGFVMTIDYYVMMDDMIAPQKVKSECLYC